MKTVTRSISLSEQLADFARQEADEGGYGNFSAYLAELIRQRRQAQIDADVRFLGDAMNHAPSGPEPVDEILAVTRSVRRQMRKEKRSAR